VHLYQQQKNTEAQSRKWGAADKPNRSLEVVTFKRESERDRGGFTCHIITNIIQFYRNEGRDGAVAEGERAPGRALLVCRVEPRGHTSRVMRRGPRDKNMG